MHNLGGQWPHKSINQLEEAIFDPQFQVREPSVLLASDLPSHKSPASLLMSIGGLDFLGPRLETNVFPYSRSTAALLRCVNFDTAAILPTPAKYSITSYGCDGFSKSCHHVSNSKRTTTSADTDYYGHIGMMRCKWPRNSMEVKQRFSEPIISVFVFVMKV